MVHKIYLIPIGKLLSLSKMPLAVRCGGGNPGVVTMIY